MSTVRFLECFSSEPSTFYNRDNAKRALPNRHVCSTFPPLVIFITQLHRINVVCGLQFTIALQIYQVFTHRSAFIHTGFISQNMF